MTINLANWEANSGEEYETHVRGNEYIAGKLGLQGGGARCAILHLALLLPQQSAFACPSE